MTKTTIYGALPHGLATSQDRINRCNQLGVGRIRAGIQTALWKGTDKDYEACRNAGLRVHYTIGYKGAPHGFPFESEIDEYLAIFTTIIAKYRPELVVIGNEVINPNFNDASIDDYIAQLRACAPIAWRLGVEITNSGDYGTGFETLIYRWLQSTQGQATADLFGNACMSPAQLKNATGEVPNPNIEQDVQNAQKLIDAYKQIGLDYWNVHLYEVLNPNITDEAAVTTATQNVLPYWAMYSRAVLEIPIMSNEVGVRNNTQPALVTAYLDALNEAGFAYADWFDGDSDMAGAKRLTDECAVTFREVVTR